MNFLGLEIRKAPLSPVLASSGRGGWNPFIREPFSGAWQRNKEIRPDTVLAYSAVYSCITRISQDVGKLRPKLVEYDDNGIWTETTSPAFSPVLNQPNRFQNYIQFREWWITSKLIHGNTYALLERDGRGVVQSIYLLDPTRVRVLVASDGTVFYELSSDNLAGLETEKVAVPASEIIHDRMNCLFHPLVGVSPIYACGVAAEMGLEIQNSSSTFFANGSNPSGILSKPVEITPDKSAELAVLWNAQFGPGGSGGVAVLGGGMTYTQMSMTAVDAQLIEQLKWTAETVCAAFHVPAFKAGIGPAPTYSAEIMNQIYYSDCLQSHIESFELCMDAALGLRNTINSGKLYGIELDLDGLLRMDTASQIESLAKAVDGALMTTDEARKKLDLKPMDGGDKIYKQQQYYSLDVLNEIHAADLLAKQNPPAPPAPPVPALPAPDKTTLPPGNRAAPALRKRVAHRARLLRMKDLAA